MAVQCGWWMTKGSPRPPIAVRQFFSFLALHIKTNDNSKAVQGV